MSRKETVPHQPPTLVLLAHGSADECWRKPFEKLLADVQDILGRRRVRLAYMEFAAPTFAEVASELRREDIRRIWLLPVFLASGAHLSTDVPEQVAAVRRQSPGLTIEILPPVGEHPRLAALLRELILEVAERAGADMGHTPANAPQEDPSRALVAKGTHR